MHSGIMAALDGVIEKNSPSLGRSAQYTSKSRLSRLPAYLTVHMIRFAWRQDIQKKAKIMRKVKFPNEYDALDLVTDDLKAKLLPVAEKLKQVEKERFERRKIRKRTKTVQPPSTSRSITDDSMAVDAPAPAPVDNDELEAESVYRQRELAELEGLEHADLKADIGCSNSGQYELVAIVTHKGAAADAGHYIGFVKKSALQPSAAAAAASAAAGSSNGATAALNEDDEDWYKFDDDKVSVFPKEKLATLDGGGEDSSAYVLLYKTRPLA